MALYSSVSHALVGDNLNVVSTCDSNELVADTEVLDVTRMGTDEKIEVKRDDIFGSKFGPTIRIIRGNARIMITPYSDDGDIDGRQMEINTVLEGGGHLFPYFTGMLVPDKDYTSHVFGRLFNRCLGASEETARRVSMRIRSGLRNLSHTRAGMIISHAYMGIEVSQQAQAPITFIIDNNSYHGFVLHTKKPVFHYGFQHTSQDARELGLQLQKLNQHDQALGEILSIINAPVNADGTPIYKHTKAQICSSRGLANAMRLLNPDVFVSTSWKDDLRKAFERVSFGDSFAPPSEKSILAFLSFVKTGDDNVLREFPAMITGRLIEERDRISFGLGIFGPKVPSLNYGEPSRCQTWILPNVGSNDPNMAVGSDGKKPLRFLPFKLESYSLGVQQWRTLCSSGKFMIPNARKGRNEFTDGRAVAFRIGSDPSFTEAYSSLKVICSAMKDVNGKKRKRNDDNVESGPSKKNRKDAANDAEEF
jgi:hypothetical protein